MLQIIHFQQISPETLKRKEEQYQRRLVAQLPVYYPGISGCRGVAEYECLNKISEGTFGVVYRAQNKRTGGLGLLIEIIIAGK